MKMLLIIWSAGIAANAGNLAGSLNDMFDAQRNSTQRATACFELRGDRAPETVEAMARALQTPELLSCAATNLRIAGATGPLLHALSSTAPEVRAAAARELGTFRDPEFLGALTGAAGDENLLAASAALEALSQYDDPAVVPHLSELAVRGGMIGDMALDRLSKLAPAPSLRIARQLLEGSQVPDRLYALRVIGSFGDSSDLPALRKIAAASDEDLEQHSRGFGFMPAINLSRAARAAIESVESRHR